MIVDTVLTQAKAFLDQKIVDCSIALEGERIFKIGRESLMPKAEVKIDLENLLVFPGLIDVHVHLRDEGKAYKEDFHSGTAAAAAGGITTVLDMPNNEPVTMGSEILRNRMRRAERSILVNVGFYSEFPKDMEEIQKIVEVGAIAFKLFMADQIGGLNINDDHELFEAFKTLSALRVPLAVHAEDRTLIEKAKERLVRGNCNSLDAFLEAHSVDAEVKAFKRLLKIASQASVHLHFCHVSTKNGLKIIIEKRKELETNLTCEVTPHHLLLSRERFMHIGTIGLTSPPLRKKEHSSFLFKSLKRGWIDVIASDHAPHTLEEKVAKSIWDVKVGIPGLETTLPLLLTEVKRGRLLLSDVVRVMAENPAKIFRLKGRGSISRGNYADLTIVDLNKEWKIDATKFYTKAKFSPFDKWEVVGKPVKTFVNGKLIMDDGEIVADAGSGKIIRGKVS